MLTKPIYLSVFASLLASTVSAAPIEAISSLDIFHRFTINSGSVPQGIVLSNTPMSLAISGTTQTALDHPEATTFDTPEVQVGNPFSAPALPYEARRVTSEEVPGGDPSVRTFYDVSVTAVDDPDALPTVTSIIDRTIDNSGEAVITSLDGGNDASAFATYAMERGYTFENTTNSLISFNIVGEIDADLLASFDGAFGTARTSVNMFTEFDHADDVSINFLGLSPYLQSTIDDDVGAFVTQMLERDSDGVRLSASTSATGDGGETDAAFDMNFRYLFMVSMQAGSTLNLLSGFSQFNSVEYTAPLAPVPVPASLPLLLIGAASFCGLRRRRSV